MQLHYVETVDDAAAFFRWLGERRPILAIDTETKGLEWWLTPPFTRLIQFGDGQQGWAISTRDWRAVAEQALQKIRDDGTATAWWNPKFDYHALEVDGFPLPVQRRAHDGYVMHHLLSPEKWHTLKGVAEESWPDAKIGQAALKFAFADGYDWATIPTDRREYWAYAALDTVLTARKVEEMWPQIHTAGYADVYEREMAVLWIMYRAERRGVRVDPVYAELLRNQWLTESANLKDELQAAGIKNPNSNKQISTVLEEAGWEPDEFTPKGAVKLDKAILMELQKTFPGDIAEKVLRFKRIVKWVGSYLTPFIEKRDSTDHVHPSIKTLGARTGRESISGPPMQQIPAKGEGGKLIRRAILPEPDQDIYAIDYDAQELRLHAHYSSSTAMIQAFRDGVDPHTFTASLAYGVPMDQVIKDQRDPAKNTRYAKLYGAGNAKIALTAGVPLHVINGVVAAIDAQFPEEAIFARRLEQVAKERWAAEGKPYVVSYGGRRITGDGDKLYALLNYLIQGSAADLLKEKTIALDAAGLSDHIILPVHDENLFSFPRDDAPELAREAGNIMQELTKFSVPLTVEVSGPYTSWGEKYGA